MTFDKYARYYNALYSDKDYQQEASYIDSLIREYAPEARTILDLGCGTGRHDFLMAEMGYDVVGVDISERMIECAISEMKGRSPAHSPSFVKGDIRSVRIDNKFDVVMSLFHVMSYQTANEDIRSALATVREHAKPDGLFIFDCWYGPAVLTDRPSNRVKKWENDAISVTRTAVPIMHPNENLVDVNYHVLVKEKGIDAVEEIREKHVMRYLFRPEVEFLLNGTGMKLLKAKQWMSDKMPGFDTWNVCFIVRT